MSDSTPQPGWVYKPGDAVKPASVDAKPTTAPPEETKVSPSTPEPPISLPEEPVAPIKTNEKAVAWTASEFIAHHKNADWYLLFIIGIGVSAGLIYLITKDFVSAFVISFAGLLFILLASHKPRELPYKVDSSGVTIGQKFYPYNHFKSFGIGDEGVINCINFMPLKRFMPEMSIYYPPEEEDKIITILADHLPHEHREEHQVDRLLKKIRF
jgi:hypothetical protein